MSTVAKGILSTGVTAFCPTVVTSPPSIYHQVTQFVHKYDMTAFKFLSYDVMLSQRITKCLIHVKGPVILSLLSYPGVAKTREACWRS